MMYPKPDSIYLRGHLPSFPGLQTVPKQKYYMDSLSETDLGHPVLTSMEFMNNSMTVLATTRK